MNRNLPRLPWRARVASSLLLALTLGPGAAAAMNAPASAAGISATFRAGAVELTINGDGADNTITISRDATGKILVNGGAVAISGGTPTVANTMLIEVNGRGGNDRLFWNPGDDSDLDEGGNGVDTVEDNGATAARSSPSRPTASAYVSTAPALLRSISTLAPPRS